MSSRELPLLKGMFMSEIHLERGRGLSPHGHPDTDELCYVISGEISYSLVEPGSLRNHLFHVTPGQVVHAPVGWCHWITSLTPGTILLLIYNTEHPHQMDIAPLWSYAFQAPENFPFHDPREHLPSELLLTPVPLQKKMETKAPERPFPAPPLIMTSNHINKTTHDR